MPLSSAKNNPPARRRAAWLIVAFLILTATAVLGQEALYLRVRTADKLTGQAPVLPLGWPDKRALAEMGLGFKDKTGFWDAANLSDKINGKAELYLAADFKAMTSGRFALAAQPSAWFEAQLFEQASSEGAFAVFSQQRRAEVQPFGWAGRGYRTDNGFYVQHGRFYLEMVAASPEPALLAAMKSWAEYWLKQQAKDNLDPAALFAGPGLKPDSVMLLAKDAFGLAGFDQVWVAEYEMEGQTCLLFLRGCVSGEEAQYWAGRLREFWLAQGGQSLVWFPPALPGAELFALEGMYQALWYSDGGCLLGAHESADSGLAARLMLDLKSHSVKE